MSYSISLRVYQRDPSRGYFHIIEQTVWSDSGNGGTWSEVDGARTLTVAGSGTSGILRFISDKGERITVAVGVHNHKRWCDIVTDSPFTPALVINGQYHNNGWRGYTRMKQLAEYSITSAAGTKFAITYTIAEGSNLAADIIIG